MHRYDLMAALLLVAQAGNAQEKPVDIPFWELRPEKEHPRYRVIGKLEQPLGSIVVAKGIVVDRVSKGPESGAILRVQFINGRATQEPIRIKLVPYFNEFGEKVVTDGHELPALESWKTYEFEGYESGGFRGTPGEAKTRSGVEFQGTGIDFMTYYCVYKGKVVAPVRWAPSDFLDREALLMGKAMSEEGRAYIHSDHWQLMVDGHAPWPAAYRNKTVEVFGTIRGTEKENFYRLDGGTTRLVQLEDQVGRQVALRGTVMGWKDPWLQYRGLRVHVENMESLPNWARDSVGRPVLIMGKLEQTLVREVERYPASSPWGRKKCFIVRNPSWEPIPYLLSPEQVELEGTRYGGRVERSVEEGLSWLRLHQNEDGRWDADGFSENCPGEDRCMGNEKVLQDHGVTGLALLAFLGNGHHWNHRSQHQRSVQQGCHWLTEEMEARADDGLIGNRRSHAFLYNHALASMALVESYLLSRAEAMKEPAQRAVDFILRMRVTDVQKEPAAIAWMVMALQAAKKAGLVVTPSGLDSALTWLDDTPEFSAATPDLDAWHFASLAMFQLGGTYWNCWEPPINAVLMESQCTEGHVRGSWDPIGPWGESSGRMSSTSLAVLCLSTDYHYPRPQSD